MRKKVNKRKINPDSFYTGINGFYNNKKKAISVSSKTKEKRKEKEIIVDSGEPMPSFDNKSYKSTENKRLENIGADVRIYNKSSYTYLIVAIIGVMVILGSFFVWGLANDKFKSELSCPDCNCPQQNLECPTISIPDCNCNQNLTCPKLNNSDIIDAINNMSLLIYNGSASQGENN